MSPRRNLLVRELVKSSATLQAAFEQAMQLDDRDLAAKIRSLQVELGGVIANASREPDQRTWGQAS